MQIFFGAQPPDGGSARDKTSSMGAGRGMLADVNVAEEVDGIDAALAGDNPGEAHGALRRLLGHPADALDDVADFRRAVGALARLSRAFGATELAARVEAVAGNPEDVQALYDVGYGLYEEKQLDLAATFFLRANRLAPGQPAIVTELAACLEGLLRHGEAALVVERSGLAASVPICAYLSGFNRLMTGDLVTARQRLAQLAGVDEEPIPFVRDALAGMVARGEALEGAGIALDDRALTAWHAAVPPALCVPENDLALDLGEGVLIRAIECFRRDSYPSPWGAERVEALAQVRVAG